MLCRYVRAQQRKSRDEDVKATKARIAKVDAQIAEADRDHVPRNDTITNDGTCEMHRSTPLITKTVVQKSPGQGPASGSAVHPGGPSPADDWATPRAPSDPGLEIYKKTFLGGYSKPNHPDHLIGWFVEVEGHGFGKVTGFDKFVLCSCAVGAGVWRMWWGEGGGSSFVPIFFAP